MSEPLRYNISSWSQATQCLSNNSRELHITVSSLMGDSANGQLIAVKHPAYGILFAAMTYGEGTLITTTDASTGDILPWMTTDEILAQLKKFGFIITYDVELHLSGDQITYLMTLNNLGFQHITTISVQMTGTKRRNFVIAFNGDEEPEWLEWPCATTKYEFDKKVSEGKVLNVTYLTAKETEFKWDWLNFIGNIPDIIRDNSPV